jgi:hypothetical protein
MRNHSFKLPLDFASFDQYRKHVNHYIKKDG